LMLNVVEKIVEISIDEAKSVGLTPCSKCAE